MYVSSYLERLKIKLAALGLEESLHLANGAEVLNAWGDMKISEDVDTHKPIGRWLRMSAMPYEDFLVWCLQHGIHAYFQEESNEIYFVRVLKKHASLERLTAEIPNQYEDAQKTNFMLAQDTIRHSIVLLRTLRLGGTNRALARLFITIVLICYRLKLDLSAEVFSEMVSDKLMRIEEPENYPIGHR